VVCAPTKLLSRPEPGGEDKVADHEEDKLANYDGVLGFPESADAPPIMPNMKPIMNPPPVTTLGIENTIIIMPHTILFAV
jgi:hypothetical protein